MCAQLYGNADRTCSPHNAERKSSPPRARRPLQQCPAHVLQPLQHGPPSPPPSHNHHLIRFLRVHQTLELLFSFFFFFFLREMSLLGGPKTHVISQCAKLLSSLRAQCRIEVGLNSGIQPRAGLTLRSLSHPYLLLLPSPQPPTPAQRHPG